MELDVDHWKDHILPHASSEILIPDSLSNLLLMYKVLLSLAWERTVYSIEMEPEGATAAAFFRMWKNSDSTSVRSVSLHSWTIYDRNCRYL